MELESTQFNQYMGKLVERSIIQSSIPGAVISLEECPPIPDQLWETMEEMGLLSSPNPESQAGYFEITLELNHNAALFCMRPSREEAVKAMEALEKQLEAGYQHHHPVEAEVAFYPEEKEPASVIATLQMEEAGTVELLSSGENLNQALREMQKLAPEAYLNS